MCIHHKIPKQRLEREYLLPLAKGIGLTTYYLRMLNAKSWQKPKILARIILGSLWGIIHLFIKHRSKVKNDLISAFELEFFLGRLQSPFYSFYKLRKNK